jgi:hypothetical protein
MRIILVMFAFVLITVIGSACRTNSLQTKLDDAIRRHASIDERIVDWGAPAEKNVLSDGRIVYTWTIPWTEHGVNYNTKGNTAYVAHNRDHRIQRQHHSNLHLP